MAHPRSHRSRFNSLETEKKRTNRFAVTGYFGYIFFKKSTHPHKMTKVFKLYIIEKFNIYSFKFLTCFFGVGVSVVFYDILNNVTKCKKWKKFEKLKKKTKTTSLSCTAHLLIHLKEWYDYFHIVKFPERYKSIWDHMLHYTQKMSHCIRETQTQTHNRRNRSVYWVYGQRETTADILTKLHAQLSFFWKSRRVFSPSMLKLPYVDNVGWVGIASELSHWYDSIQKNLVASGIRTPDLPLSRRTP